MGDHVSGGLVLFGDTGAWRITSHLLFFFGNEGVRRGIKIGEYRWSMPGCMRNDLRP